MWQWYNVKDSIGCVMCCPPRWDGDRANKNEEIQGAMNATDKEDDQLLIEELQDPQINLSDALEKSDVPLMDDNCGSPTKTCLPMDLLLVAQGAQTLKTARCEPLRITEPCDKR